MPSAAVNGSRPYALNNGTRVLSPSVTLSPAITVSLPPPGKRAHVHAALAQGLQQRQDLPIPSLAQRHRRRLLHGPVGAGHARNMCRQFGRRRFRRRCCNAPIPTAARPAGRREGSRGEAARARRREAYSLYVERRLARANEAYGPLSASSPATSGTCPWCLTQSQPLSGLVYWLHGSAFTRPLERETTLNCPSFRISPISTGL